MFVAVLIVFTFVGCSKAQVSEQPKEEISISDRNITLNEDPVKDLKMKYPGPELPESNIFVNEECGYKFVFPEEWTGWYFVNDEIPEIATIRFYGKSIRGTILEKEFLSADFDYGLTMFFILSEEEAGNGFYDSVTKIGTAKGVNYYFATTTDVSIAPLIEDKDFWFNTDEELKLAEEDFEKVKSMMDFYSPENRENFIKCFSEI